MSGPGLSHLRTPFETSQRSRPAAVPLEHKMCVKARPPGMRSIRILQS